MKKPRIVKKNGLWVCDGIAFGNTPQKAYAAWWSFEDSMRKMFGPSRAYPEKAVKLGQESGEDSMSKPQVARARLRRFWSDFFLPYLPGTIALWFLLLAIVAKGYTC